MTKSAFILGGTRGLGLELARESCRRGITPIITGSSISKDGGYPSEAITHKIDLTEFSEEVHRQALRRYITELNPRFFFWNAGIFLPRNPFYGAKDKDLERMVKVHFEGPLKVLREFHNFVGRPYHLITIASTSSYKVRDNESIYCALKSAKAHFTRNFASEMVRDHPGSKVTLIHPSGIKTALFKHTNTDTSKFMEPADVAKIIWNEIECQEASFKELHIIRRDDAPPVVLLGQRLPETP